MADLNQHGTLRSGDKAGGKAQRACGVGGAAIAGEKARKKE